MKFGLFIAFTFSMLGIVCGVKCMVGYNINYFLGSRHEWKEVQCPAGEECFRGDGKISITAYYIFTVPATLQIGMCKTPDSCDTETCSRLYDELWSKYEEQFNANHVNSIYLKTCNLACCDTSLCNKRTAYAIKKGDNDMPEEEDPEDIH